LFNSIQILSENWLSKTINDGELASEVEFDYKNVFKSLTQNDISVFYGAKISKNLSS